jgi:uncharacterized phage protein gp47/JayE
MPPTSIATLCYIDATGYHYPDYPTTLAWLTSQYQSIYGVDVYLGADSQDGQLLAIFVQALYDTMAQGASTYNSFSPLSAQGVGLSRLVAINGLTRLSASYSTVTLTITGTYGTVITNGVAADVLNQQWLLPASVTIPFGGTIDVLAVAANIGSVFADLNTITTLFTPTNGWQTVNNAAAATPGAAVESDAALRIRQSISTQLPAQTVFDATLGAVANVAGVTKVAGWENQTSSANYLGQELPAHSINVTTVGGATLDICNAIVAKKTPGTNTSGNTGPTLCYDAAGMPIDIYYSIAVTAEIQVVVTLTPLPGWSSNFSPLIQEAVAAYINALPIGSALLFNQLFVPAYLFGTSAAGTFTITAITTGLNGGGQSTDPITLQVGMQGSGPTQGAQNPVCNGATGGDVLVTVS